MHAPLSPGSRRDLDGTHRRADDCDRRQPVRWRRADVVRDVAVFVGSLRQDSINRMVANALIELAPAPMKLETVEIGQLALYNQDQDDSPPAPWSAFRERVKA